MSTREITAQEIMTSPVITVQSQMTVEEVSDLLSSHMITGAPVLDENERHIGVVTLSDIVRNEPRREHIISDKVASDYVLKAWQPQFSAEELTGYHLEESETLLAKDIMTPFIYRVQEETPVSEIAQIMLSGRIHRLFVARDDEIVGVVSVLDMLKMFVNAVK